ncbi:hypothetical protein [Pelomonas sp. SE-A7]|uniref:hypothetical protein n=1 Tax=Pelomonas sp. SE-A7 TaxID=3054953 RepID=UPI00259CF192|nr:hypothetical protein [Pelomonas sp. SE-A7]MDM4765491.1 hypothetical protein [Pelomonas sp. SE-A7]
MSFEVLAAEPDCGTSPPTRRTLLKSLAGAAAAIAGVGLTGQAQATQIKPHNLTRLINDADTIVGGKVIRVTDGMQGKLPYTEVTISVATSAKKKLVTRSEYTFRQFGLQKARKMPDGRFFLGLAPEGMAKWKKDEQVLAFLYKPAARTGLRTTVGLGMGKFLTMGDRMANAFNNRGLFQDVRINPGLLNAAEQDMLAKNGGDVDSNVLIGLVNKAVAGQWIQKGLMK